MEIIHWIGIDDHADKWTICQLQGNDEKPAKEFELTPSDAGYRKLIAFLKGLGGEARVVYEAGPCGYEMYRRLTKAGLRCQVAAPSMTPCKPGDRVKTNRRDAAKLARYLRSGDLVMIDVPDAAREAVRDLTRAREAAQKDLVSIRHQISKLLLRYGHRYRDGHAWTAKYWRWLLTIRLLDDSQAVLDEMVMTHQERSQRVARLVEKIHEVARRPEYASYVNALTVLRGIDTVSAMTILAELGDLRRFASARQLMAAIGLVPGEHSTGDKTVRLSITKVGNAHVRHIAVQAAWHYRHRPGPAGTVGKRRKGQSAALLDIATRCDARLHRKLTRMIARNKRSTVAAVAAARELIGFIWAIGQIIHP